MALPRAVQKIGDAAEAAAAGMTGAPTQPNTGGNQGQQPSTQPADAPAVPQTDDWEKRYKNYKAGTDQTIADLRAKQDTFLQREQELNDRIRAMEDQLRNKPPEVAATVPVPDTIDVNKVYDDPRYKAWLDTLPASFKDDYTDEFLRDQFIFSLRQQPEKTEDPELKAIADKVNRFEQFQEKTNTQLYEEALDAAFPNDAWLKMTTGDVWQAFCQKQESPYHPVTYGQIVAQASKAHDSKTVIRVLNDFQKHQSALDGGSLANGSMAGQVTPDGSGGGNPIQDLDANSPTYTVTQVNKFYKDIATTKKYTAEQAAEIEKSIAAAHKAGRIVQG